MKFDLTRDAQGDEGGYESVALVEFRTDTSSSSSHGNYTSQNFLLSRPPRNRHLLRAFSTSRFCYFEICPMNKCRLERCARDKFNY